MDNRHFGGPRPLPGCRPSFGDLEFSAAEINELLKLLIKMQDVEGLVSGVNIVNIENHELLQPGNLSLEDLGAARLANMNDVFVPWQGSAYATRNYLPALLRRKGISISYVTDKGLAVKERAVSDVGIDNANWGIDSNWMRVDELSLNGQLYVSPNGTWVINGVDSGIQALGPKGDNGLTPRLKTIDNKLHYSYDGKEWLDAGGEHIAAWFRWSGNKIQISRDNKTWEDFSGEFADNLFIKGYVDTFDKLPADAVQGDIWGVGPVYAADDAEQTNPRYRYYVRNAGGWVDNGEFTSIAAGIVQETGDGEGVVMSQKAVTENIDGIRVKVDSINTILATEETFTDSKEGNLSVEDSNQYTKYFMLEYGYKLGDKVVVTYESDMDVVITSCIYGTGSAVIKNNGKLTLEANTPVSINTSFDGAEQLGYAFGGFAYQQGAFNIKITIEKRIVNSPRIDDIENNINKTVGKNLINVNDIIKGVHFNGENMVNADGYSTSNYIAIEGDKWYNIHGVEIENYTGILFYSEKNNNSKIGSAIMYSIFGSAMAFKTPKSAKYLRVGFGKKTTSELIGLQLERGYCPSSYVPFQKLQYYDDEGLFSVNMFKGYIEGYSINTTSYYISESDIYTISQPIAVEVGKTYYIKSDRLDYLVAGSDWNKSGSVKLGNTDNGSLTITIPNGVHYIHIGNINKYDKFVVSEILVDDVSIKYNPIPIQVYNAFLDLYNSNNDIFNKSLIATRQYGITNNGYEYSAETRIAKIPVKPSTIYTWFNGVVSTEFVPLAFRCSDGNLRLGDGCLVSPSSGVLDFSTPSTMATYYTERVYFKTSSNAEYVEIKITDAMLEADEMHLYEGILYQNPAVCKDFKNAKINALVIGDSYWDKQGADYYGCSIANQLRDVLGINYVMNFAQGGGRLIHSEGTKDVTSYNESYENGSAMNVYSNQFLKYKLRHEENPSKYPLPNMVIIGGLLNNLGLFDKFDEDNFNSVFSASSSEMNETLFSGAFKRLITLIYSVVGDIPIIYVGSSSTRNQTYIVTEMERVHEIACKCFAIKYVSYMQEGMRFYNSDDYTDGVHPTESSAKKIAGCIATKLNIG